MTPKNGCSKRRRLALVLATIWLSGSAAADSDDGVGGACPPVVEYSRDFQARVAGRACHMNGFSAKAGLDRAQRVEAAPAGFRILIFDATFPPQATSVAAGNRARDFINSPPHAVAVEVIQMGA